MGLIRRAVRGVTKTVGKLVPKKKSNSARRGSVGSVNSRTTGVSNPSYRPPTGYDNPRSYNNISSVPRPSTSTSSLRQSNPRPTQTVRADIHNSPSVRPKVIKQPQSQPSTSRIYNGPRRGSTSSKSNLIEMQEVNPRLKPIKRGQSQSTDTLWENDFAPKTKKVARRNSDSSLFKSQRNLNAPDASSTTGLITPGKTKKRGFLTKTKEKAQRKYQAIKGRIRGNNKYSPIPEQSRITPLTNKTTLGQKLNNAGTSLKDRIKSIGNGFNKKKSTVELIAEGADAAASLGNSAQKIGKSGSKFKDMMTILGPQLVLTAPMTAASIAQASKPMPDYNITQNFDNSVRNENIDDIETEIKPLPESKPKKDNDFIYG